MDNIMEFLPFLIPLVIVQFALFGYIRLSRNKDIYAITYDCDCNRSNLFCNQHSNL